MEQEYTDMLTLSADVVPAPLAEWIDQADQPAMLVSMERLADGRVVMQTVPGIDPALVARLRKVLAQHADVLRRLT